MLLLCAGVGPKVARDFSRSAHGAAGEGVDAAGPSAAALPTGGGGRGAAREAEPCTTHEAGELRARYEKGKGSEGKGEGGRDGSRIGIERKIQRLYREMV